MTRRRRLSGLLAACMLLFSLSGCGKQEASASAPASFGDAVDSAESALEPVVSQPATTTGVFSMPYNSGYGWDPYNCKSMENQAVMQLIYQGLFTMNASFDPEPVLCKEYTVSDDGLTYTITLQNATFSNGSSVTASDVVYSLSQASDSDLYDSRFTDIASYEASGTDTVILYLSSPNDRLPCLLNFPIIPNLSSAASGPVGSGPFVRNGDVLTKNQNWWQGANTVQFQTVTLYSSASAEDTRDNFEMDNIHFVYNNPNSASAASFHCDYELWNSKNTVMQYMGFNLSAGICSDKDIRTAIIRAIDRTEIAESVYHNFADPTELPVAPTSSMYDEALARDYQYDADAALEQLLKSSSFYLPEDDPRRKNGPGAQREAAVDSTQADATVDSTVDEPPADAGNAEADTAVTSPQPSPDQTENTVAYNEITMLVLSGSLSRSAAAKLAAGYLEDVGFTVNIQTLGEDDFISTINAGKFDLYYADVCLTPDMDLRPLLLSDGSLNYSFIPPDSTLEAHMDSALENSGNRYDLYQYVMNQGYICPVLFENNAVFTTRGVFTGLNPAPGNLFYQIENITVQ